MARNEHVVYCKICKSEIHVFEEVIKISKDTKAYSNHRVTKPSTQVDSEEGVLFKLQEDGKYITGRGNHGTWFCNDCWGKIIDD